MEEEIKDNDITQDIACGQAGADNPCAQNTVAAEAAEAEKEVSAAPATGKFKSVEALLEAYNNLEAEFTRRCQKLKELEESKAATPSPAGDDNSLLAAALADSKVKNAVVGEYLKTVLSGKSVPLMVDGLSCAAPKVNPATVKEAGLLAKQFLKN